MAGNDKFQQAKDAQNKANADKQSAFDQATRESVQKALVNQLGS